MNPIDAQVDLLARLLDVSSLRHRVIASNVANVNTPGYRQREVVFEETLEKALRQGDAASTSDVRPQVVEATGGAQRADGNNVDIDLEIGRLTKNTLLYRTFAQVLAVRMAAMRSAITGRQG